MSKNKPALVIWHLQEARICALTAFLAPFVISQGYKSFQRINFVRTISSVEKRDDAFSHKNTEISWLKTTILDKGFSWQNISFDL